MPIYKNNKLYGIEIDFVGSPTPPVQADYFYIEDISGNNNTVTIKKSGSSAPTIRAYYSTDQVTWTSMGDTTTSGVTTTIPANGKMYFRCVTEAWGAGTYYNTITCSGNHNVGGNIMSLLYGEDFGYRTKFYNTTSTDVFRGLFRNDTTLVNANELELPATTLVNYCYSYLFGGCSNLITAPELPATTLADHCYYYMFAGCTSLTTPPILSATRFTGTYCYASMFNGCSALTVAPELPAISLGDYCYQSMFQGCTSLTTAPELPAFFLSANCYDNMFYNCTGLTIAPALTATTLASACYQNMFRGCTALTATPDLPATTLTDRCYNMMFYGCTSLTQVSIYANSVSATQCISNWLYNVSQTGDFYNLGQATYTVDSASGIPQGWTLHTTTPPSPTPEPTPQNDYFYVEDLSGDGCTFTIKKNYNYNDRYGNNPSHNPQITMYYSTDQENWYKLTDNITANGISHSVPAGGKLYLKAINEYYSGYDSACQRDINTYINCDKYFAVGGNIMSLLFGDNFRSGNITTGYYTNAFRKLFYYTKVTDASNLYTADANGGVSYGCYDSTFMGSNLTTPPALPATTLMGFDYTKMFVECKNLTTAPVLPATTLAHDCYSYMFMSCSALTTAPTISATTLAENCCEYMFSGCTGLTTAPTLLATTLTENCYAYMFGGCSSLTTAPTLLATTLVKGCYNQMFTSCSSLNRVVTYATNISASQCLLNWLYNVAAQGNFYNLGGATYPSGKSGIPSGWTEHNSL